jgi:MerC mercury resistance protein
VHAMSLNATSLTLDRAGMAASVACAVHCAATPFVVIILPFGGLALTGGSVFETLFAMGSVLIGSVSARIGLSLHNSRRPLLMVLLGGLLIAAGRFASSETIWPETVLVVSGVCLIAGAHAVNLCLCRCHACHVDEPVLAIEAPVVRS